MTTFVSMLIIVAIIPFLFWWQTKNNHADLNSGPGEINSGLYQVTWYKQGGQPIRERNLTAEEMIKQVKSSFKRAQETSIKFEELDFGYRFSRPNWSHSGRRESQKFGYIVAVR
jgi:hypothetical protein